MFWYNTDTLKSLFAYIRSHDKSIHQSIRKEFIEKAGLDLNFNFKSQNINLAIDNEFLLIEIVKKHVNPQKFCNNVNLILQKSNLEYKEGKIINKQGAFSIVQKEIRGSQIIINKTGNQTEISKEYAIIKSLNEKDADAKEDTRYVIKVFDISEDNISYNMEYAFNSLEKYISSTITKQERLEIVKNVTEDLLFVHNNDIVHKDLHPGNILLVKNDKAEEIRFKIADFGLASSSMHVTNRRYCGREEYRSPEQYPNLSNATFQSDIYSLGKLINFIMTGNPKNTRHMLSAIVFKCCETKMSNRYKSVEEIIQEINKLTLLQV